MKISFILFLSKKIWLCQFILTSNTVLYAFSTSPGCEKRLSIISFNSGYLSLANRTGAVAKPSFKSAAAGLPVHYYKK